MIRSNSAVRGCIAGLITENKGGGRYAVELTFDNSASDALISINSGKESDLNSDVADQVAIIAVHNARNASLYEGLSLVDSTNITDAEKAVVRKQLSDEISLNHRKIFAVQSVIRLINMQIISVRSNTAFLERYQGSTVNRDMISNTLNSTLSGVVPVYLMSGSDRSGVIIDSEAIIGRFGRTTEISKEHSFVNVALLSASVKWSQKYVPATVLSVTGTQVFVEFINVSSKNRVAQPQSVLPLELGRQIVANPDGHNYSVDDIALVLVDSAGAVKLNGWYQEPELPVFTLLYGEVLEDNDLYINQKYVKFNLRSIQSSGLKDSKIAYYANTRRFLQQYTTLQDRRMYVTRVGNKFLNELEINQATRKIKVTFFTDPVTLNTSSLVFDIPDIFLSTTVTSTEGVIIPRAGFNGYNGAFPERAYVRLDPFLIPGFSRSPITTLDISRPSRDIMRVGNEIYVTVPILASSRTDALRLKWGFYLMTFDLNFNYTGFVDPGIAHLVPPRPAAVVDTLQFLSYNFSNPPI